MSTASQTSSQPREPELSGQTVLVIGASSGIGLETARQARNAGAEVRLVGRNQERLERAALELGAQDASAFDAADPAAIERYFGDLPGPVDHVMVTAGGPHYGPVLEMDREQARNGIDAQLLLVLDIARQAVSRVRPGGTLLFMTGTGARRPGVGEAVIGTATAAIPALVANLALELAPVRINLIAAGFVDTPLSASILGDDLESRREQLRATLPIRRVVGPADVAALAVHIMSNTALTGATYDVDGGEQLVATEADPAVEFLVEFDLKVPEGTASTEADARKQAESAAAAALAREGHLARLWALPAGASDSRAVGLYRAQSRAQLDALLGALPLADWMRITVTELAAHPNDAAPARLAPAGGGLPDPRLTFAYRLEASVGEPLELGEVNGGRRRIVPLTAGTVSGPSLNGTLVAGVSADWQLIGPDGTVAGDVRYAIATDGGELLYVRSQGIRHGSQEVLARLGRGEAVDAGEYTFRTAVQIETAAPALDWLNKGIFISVAGRLAGGVVYDTYLVA